MLWVDAKGFEGRLQVTRCGLVRSVDRVVYNHPDSTRKLKGRVLKCSTGKSGYKVVDLRVRGKNKIGRVELLHRIVANTFLDKVVGLDHVNHIDGDKLNNNISNLERCNHQMNISHAWSTGLCDSQKKPVISSNGGFGVYYPYMRKVISDGFNPSLVHAAMNGRQNTHGGFKWGYALTIPENSEYQQLLDKQDE
tara:strand:+ start:215 stop:796 length:582 start_codon:yes stop_codon:yes gene_type:complete